MSHIFDFLNFVNYKLPKYNLGIQQVDIPPGSTDANLYNEMMVQMNKGAQEGQTAGLGIPIFGALKQRDLQREGLEYGRVRGEILSQTQDAQRRAAQQFNNAAAQQEAEFGAIQSGIQLTPSDLLTYDSTRMAKEGAQSTKQIPVEIENNELIFDNYKLKDHAIGGARHDEFNPNSPTGTGEVKIVEEGDTIIPRKYFDIVVRMLDKNGFIKEEMRDKFDSIVESLPEDVQPKKELPKYFLGVENISNIGNLGNVLQETTNLQPQNSGVQNLLPNNQNGFLDKNKIGENNNVSQPQVQPQEQQQQQQQQNLNNQNNKVGNFVQQGLDSLSELNPYLKAAKIGIDFADKFIATDANNQLQGLNESLGVLGQDLQQRDRSQWSNVDYLQAKEGAQNVAVDLKNARNFLLSYLNINLEDLEDLTEKATPETDNNKIVDYDENYFLEEPIKFEGYPTYDEGTNQIQEQPNLEMPPNTPGESKEFVEKSESKKDYKKYFKYELPKGYQSKGSPIDPKTKRFIGSTTATFKNYTPEELAELWDLYSYNYDMEVKNNPSLRNLNRNVKRDMFGHIFGDPLEGYQYETFFGGDFDKYSRSFVKQQNYFADKYKDLNIDIPKMDMTNRYRTINDFIKNYGVDKYTYHKPLPGDTEGTPLMASWKLNYVDDSLEPPKTKTLDTPPSVDLNPISNLPPPPEPEPKPMVEPLETRKPEFNFEMPQDIANLGAAIPPPQEPKPEPVPKEKKPFSFKIPDLDGFLNKPIITPGPLMTTPEVQDPIRVRLEEKNVDNTDLNRAIQQQQIANRAIVQQMGATGLKGFGGLASSIANAADGVSNLEIEKARRLNQVKDANVDIRNQERLINAQYLEKAMENNAASRAAAEAENLAARRDFFERNFRDRQQELYNQQDRLAFKMKLDEYKMQKDMQNKMFDNLNQNVITSQDLGKAAQNTFDFFKNVGSSTKSAVSNLDSKFSNIFRNPNVQNTNLNNSNIPYSNLFSFTGYNVPTQEEMNSYQNYLNSLPLGGALLTNYLQRNKKNFPNNSSEIEKYQFYSNPLK